MAKARKIIGNGKGISGNVDPLVLLGPEEKIRESVRTCVSRFVALSGSSLRAGTAVHGRARAARFHADF